MEKKYEPFIRCFGLMNSIQKVNEHLSLKVYYEEWLPEELQFIGDLYSVTNIISESPDNAFE